MKRTELARKLGGTINGSWINIRGPGHRKEDRSLGISLNPSAPDGFLIHSFAQDDVAECRRYVKALLAGLELDLDVAQPPEQLDHEKAERVRRALLIWEDSVPGADTLVEKYLASRGCSLTLETKAADVLRFNSSCRFGADRAPAMIALMRDLISDVPTGIHRTALTDSGTGKRDLPGGSKRMSGIAAQAAVKLGAHSGDLGVAEGIETALSASDRYGLPVWALLAAGNMKRLPVLPGVKRLIVFADNDDPGLTAAYECARRYTSNGIPVGIRHPKTANADFNDLRQELIKCR